MTVSNAGADVAFVCKGGGSQEVMDEHGGSRGDLVIALRQVLKRQLRRHMLLAHIFLHLL